MCSGSEAGSYLRLIDFVYHSTLDLRGIKKKKKKKGGGVQTSTSRSCSLSRSFLVGGCRAHTGSACIYLTLTTPRCSANTTRVPGSFWVGIRKTAPSVRC